MTKMVEEVEKNVMEEVMTNSIWLMLTSSRVQVGWKRRNTRFFLTHFWKMPLRKVFLGDFLKFCKISNENNF